MEEVQCYLKDCKKKAYPGSYWCTRTHQLEWQKENYGNKEIHKTYLTIPQIQERLKEMGKMAKLKEGKLI